MTGIILYGPFELAPYSRNYMNILKESGVKYDLIGWRREEEIKYSSGNVYMYEGSTAKRFSSALLKILPSLGYRRFVKKLIKKKKYDKLIILTTQTTVILADVLLGKYRKKYIFDYRDRSYEYIKPYRALINALVNASDEMVISSPWFAELLTDKKNYIQAHNLQNEYLSYRKDKFEKKAPGEKIIAGYVGALRSYDYHKWLIDIFANDSRFEFHTYGCGDDCDKLAEYASQFDNTFVHGGYREQEKYKIIDTFDMMCYNYPYNFVNDAAIANKYYDSLIMKKPMFVNPKTRLGDFIVRNGMGVGIDENDMNAADKIFDWYINADEEKFVRACDLCLDKYIKENKVFEEKIRKACLS